MTETVFCHAAAAAAAANCVLLSHPPPRQRQSAAPADSQLPLITARSFPDCLDSPCTLPCFDPHHVCPAPNCRIKTSNSTLAAPASLTLDPSRHFPLLLSPVGYCLKPTKQKVWVQFPGEETHPTWRATLEDFFFSIPLPPCCC